MQSGLVGNVFQIPSELIRVKYCVITSGIVCLHEDVSPHLLIVKMIIRHLNHDFRKVEDRCSLVFHWEHFGQVRHVSIIIDLRVEVYSVAWDVVTSPINCPIWIYLSVRVVPSVLRVSEILDVLVHIEHGHACDGI